MARVRALVTSILGPLGTQTQREALEDAIHQGQNPRMNTDQTERSWLWIVADCYGPFYDKSDGPAVVADMVGAYHHNMFAPNPRREDVPARVVEFSKTHPNQIVGLVFPVLQPNAWLTPFRLVTAINGRQLPDRDITRPASGRDVKQILVQNQKIYESTTLVGILDIIAGVENIVACIVTPRIDNLAGLADKFWRDTFPWRVDSMPCPAVADAIAKNVNVSPKQRIQLLHVLEMNKQIPEISKSNFIALCMNYGPLYDPVWGPTALADLEMMLDGEWFRLNSRDDVILLAQSYSTQYPTDVVGLVFPTSGGDAHDRPFGIVTVKDNNTRIKYVHRGAPTATSVNRLSIHIGNGTVYEADNLTALMDIMVANGFVACPKSDTTDEFYSTSPVTHGSAHSMPDDEYEFRPSKRKAMLEQGEDETTK
jgi:hypothetical protein